MGLFRIRGTNSMLDPLCRATMHNRWLDVRWRGPTPSLRQSKPPDSASLHKTNRFLFQPRAINPHSPDRAIQSIQRALLRRRPSSSTSAPRRWMLPTVERGPPGSMRLNVGW